MKIYEIHNPLFLSDIFVFGEIESIGMCYIKVNHHNKIEEIGIDIQERMNKTIEDILKSSKITSVNSKNSLLIDNTNTGGETNG